MRQVTGSLCRRRRPEDYSLLSATLQIIAAAEEHQRHLSARFSIQLLLPEADTVTTWQADLDGLGFLGKPSQTF